MRQRPWLARVRERECDDKRRYDTYADAKQVAEERARATGRELRAYQCMWCARFHLTSSAPRTEM